MNWEKLYNPFVIWLLRSPFHGLIDKSTLLITYTGRKSGKIYTFPVSYVRDGDTLMIISRREHTWWKNFRGGIQVRLYLRGRTLKASGEVFTDAEIVTNKLLMFLRQFPGYQRLMHMKLAADGQPESPEAFQRFAQSMVIIQMKELVEAAAQPKAGLWVLANALAWMVGMVIVFVGTNFIPPEGISLTIAFVLLLFLFVAGAAVGAIHGLVLVWLLHLRSGQRSSWRENYE